MCEIRDKNGKVISRSKNLAGIRRYVSKVSTPIKLLDVSRIGKSSEGKLSILFDDGVNFETNFASLEVLKGWVRRWRNVHGAPLSINGELDGSVSYHHTTLMESST